MMASSFFIHAKAKKPGSFLVCVALVALGNVAAICQVGKVSEDVRMVPHPRLFLTTGQEQRLDSVITARATFAGIHNVILDECETLLNQEPVSYQKTGRRLLSVAREGRRRVTFLSYGWRLTNRTEFFERAKAELLALSRFPDWNPSHFLDAAEITVACAIGFDWLYESLTSRERAEVANAIREKGLLPSLKKEFSGWLSQMHNWNQVCNASLAIGAMAIMECDPMLGGLILERSINSIALPIKSYGTTGAYPEGYGYWEYGTTFHVMLISAFENLTIDCLKLSPGFLNTGQYMLHCTGPSGRCFNYSDNHEKAQVHPAMFWFAARNNDPTLLFQEMELLKNTSSLERVRELPLLVIWGASIDPDLISSPDSKMWVSAEENAVATIRSGWSPGDTFIGFKAGSPSYNHGHMDVGSFVLDAQGERWASDAGPQDYNSLESAGLDIWNRDQRSDRWRVFRYGNSIHNTLTINNAPQRVDGVSPIITTWRDKSSSGVAADLTPVYVDYARKIERRVAVTRDGAALVHDNIQLHTGGPVRWNMATMAEVIVHSSDWVELKQNSKSVFVRIIATGEPNVSVVPATPPSEFDTANPDLKLLQFTLQVRRGARAEILVVFSEHAEMRFVEEKELRKWLHL